MKHILSILVSICLLSGTAVFAQTTFNYKNDFKKILEKTKDKKDSLYCDRLLSRFNANDTSMTDYQVLALLIGFTDKKEYKPYSDLSKEREIYDLNGDGKYEKALKEGKSFLKTHPVSVKTLFEVSYSFYKMGNKDSASAYMYRGRRIFDAMHFTGDGLSPETPMFSLGPADGQDFIYKYLSADIGIMGSGSDPNGAFLDILEAKFKDGSSHNLYFIIQHATDKMFAR